MSSFCTGCGAALDEDDRFCGKCGRPRSEAAASENESAPPAPPGAKPNVFGAIIGVALLVVVPLVVMFGLSECGSAEGRVAVSGGPHGEWTFVPTGCASMQPYGSMGANLHGDGHNDGAVYVTLDHVEGHRVELEVPGSCRNADGTDCTVFPVPRAACSTYDVSLDYNGVTVNDVRLVEGHVRLSCALEDGTRVEGAIEFDGC